MSTRQPSLIFILSLITCSVFPAPRLPDSIPPKQDSLLVYYFYHHTEQEGTLDLHAYDTAITGFQNYNPLYSSSFLYAPLGNIGTASRNLAPSPVYQSSGFDYGIHTFDPFLFRNDSVHYYKVSKIFTDLRYTQGAKKELFFDAKFSRNIYRSLNLGFEFRVANSPGAYLRQRTNIINFVITAQYFSKDKRYGVVANFLANRIKDQENGGITNDSLFEQNLETNRQIIPVNLQDAENRVRESGFFMKHFFDITRHYIPKNDSVLTKKKRTELGRLTYSFEYNRRIQNYTDNLADSVFYRTNFLVDSTGTRDSITIQKICNTISWTNPNFNKQKKFRTLQLQGKLTQQYFEVSFHDQKYFFIQYIPSAWLSFRPFNSLTLESYADYVLGDYNEGDMSLWVKLSQVLGKENKNAGEISLTGQYSFQKPHWFYQRYLGNNFDWNNHWEKQTLITATASYSYKFLQSGISINRITNYVYLDSLATPQQENTQIGYLYAWLNTNLDIWRFKFNGQFAYQSVQGSDILRLPMFIGNLTIFYTQQLFKGAATLQPGVNLFYNTSYFADSYMPATRSFYLQKSKKIGNYLYMDVFINLKIQRARIFVMYSHFNSSFMGHTYYMVPHYPMQDAAFKFGISWRFFD